jgi:hypothetical protein
MAWFLTKPFCFTTKYKIRAMRIYNYNLIRFITIPALLVLFTLNFACQKKPIDNPVNGQARVKFVNTISTELPQNISVDENKIDNVSLSFADESDYYKLNSGVRQISFFSNSDITLNKEVNYTSSMVYTTFLIADKAGLKDYFTIEDGFSTSDVDKAKIRIINLTPNFTTGINISITGGTQFGNALIFKDASNYFVIDPNVDLRYNVVGSTNFKTISSSKFLPGKVYTIWFSGTSASNLEAHLIVNN